MQDALTLQSGKIAGLARCWTAVNCMILWLISGAVRLAAVTSGYRLVVYLLQERIWAGIALGKLRGMDEDRAD